MIARLGEWNTESASEPLPVQEIPVSTVIIHPQFYNPGLYNDIALVILSRPITPAINVRPVCLPPQNPQTVPVGTRCFATGWGRSSFGKSFFFLVLSFDFCYFFTYWDKSFNKKIIK